MGKLYIRKEFLRKLIPSSFLRSSSRVGGISAFFVFFIKRPSQPHSWEDRPKIESLGGHQTFC